ncbi:hypothetical protein LR948_16450 [Roseivivax sp. GX 12232]|uniref:hypothetical protein n=1 Tax=Roseivivax sp. GX 12232 TaxID=2900547 RepID=UPI001E36D080|nr:hypothetical protein [Roseivivax sp. GX 12232]MCE0506962.1 hypothetical protein [Roseivivax sp. GX 12232]
MVDPRLACAALALCAATPALAAPLGPLRPEAATAPGAAPVIQAQALDRRVTETTDLPTWELQQLRRRMLDGKPISFQDMRRLADAGDGLAAFRYAERLLELDGRDMRSAAALYLASAGLTGRDYAVYELVRLLDQRDIDFSEARLDHLENAMRNLALQGSDTASEALLRYYETGHPFGRKPGKVEALLEEKAAAGDAEAALELATEALSGAGPEDPARLRGLLKGAMQAESLGTRTAAQNLLRQLDTQDTSNSEEAPE